MTAHTNAKYDDAKSVSDDVNDFLELRQTVADFITNLKTFEARARLGEELKEQLLALVSDTIPEGQYEEEIALMKEVEEMGFDFFDPKVPNYISVNKQLIAQNNKNPDSAQPTLRHCRGKNGKGQYAFHLRTTAPVEVIYNPHGPLLKCGARCVIKTVGNVEVIA